MLARLALLALGLAASLPATATSLDQQRRLYDQASRALASGNPAIYHSQRASLRGYPLEGYLVHDELKPRLASASVREVEDYLTQYGDLPQNRFLLPAWLRQLASRSDWSTFARHYPRASDQPEVQCLQAEYLLASGQRAQAITTAQQVWLAASNALPGCETIFNQLKVAGELPIGLQWQRFRSAAAAGNTSFARTLLSDMPANFAAAGQRLLDVLARPALLENTTQFAQNYTTNADTVLLGLRRMAKDSPDRALALLDEYNRVLTFDPAERLTTARTLAMIYARRFDERALQIMLRYDPQLQDAGLTEWRNRLLLRQGRWQDVLQLTRQLPASQAATPQWRYWSARSLQMVQPNSPQLYSMYQAAASERDYYSFLAADRIAGTYQLNHRPVPVDQATLQRVAASPLMRRIKEFKARGMDTEASREWQHASKVLGQTERLALARLGHQYGWYFPAITALSQAQYWDDLDVRFPMAHQNILTQAARNQRIQPSWAYAIARQESAFRTDARSGSGAMGLMQLMPGTAKETARRYNIPLRNPSEAYRPEINVQLGTAYLNQMYNRFGNNRILASAAYNAGPGNVGKWLNSTAGLPHDVWIESIPFDETRGYVRNVLTYSVIYGQKLGQPQKLVEAHEQRITAP